MHAWCIYIPVRSAYILFVDLMSRQLSAAIVGSTLHTVEFASDIDNELTDEDTSSAAR